MAGTEAIVCTVVLLLSIFVTSSAAVCPEACSCVPSAGPINGVDVNCILSTPLSESWPAHTRQIHVWFTKYPDGGLQRGAFNNMDGIVSITLRGRLGVVHSGAFHNLTGYMDHLGYRKANISFDKAEISRMSSGAFENVHHFHSVELISSNIDVIESDAFVGVSQIYEFKTSSVVIGRAETRCFGGMLYIDRIVLSDTDIEVLLNFAFLDITYVNVFRVDHTRVTICMGKYAFTGMGSVHKFHFAHSKFPTEPLLDGMEAYDIDDDNLWCSNGWRVPESRLWFYKHRLELAVGFSILLLVLVTITGVLCVHCWSRKMAVPPEAEAAVAVERLARPALRWSSRPRPILLAVDQLPQPPSYDDPYDRLSTRSPPPDYTSQVGTITTHAHIITR